MKLHYNLDTAIIVAPLTDQEFTELGRLVPDGHFDRTYLDVLIATFRKYDKLEKTTTPGALEADIDALSKAQRTYRNLLGQLSANPFILDSISHRQHITKAAIKDKVTAFIDALTSLTAEIAACKPDLPVGKSGRKADTRYATMWHLNNYLLATTGQTIRRSKKSVGPCAFARKFFKIADPSLEDEVIMETIKQVLEKRSSDSRKRADKTKTLELRVSPNHPRAIEFDLFGGIPTSAFQKKIIAASCSEFLQGISSPSQY